MRLSWFSYAVLLSLTFQSAAQGRDGALTPVRLRCEHLENAIGLDELRPRLSWIVKSDHRGAKQTAYRIVVASSRQELTVHKGNLWDSGRVESDQTVLIPYAGNPLTSRRQCFWKVMVWDDADKPSPWSKPARWSMGLLDKSDWAAEYISYRDESPVFKDRKSHFLPPARQYRKQFDVKSQVRRATIYATALGIYELSLNGQRVGDAYFAPGWTDYRQRAYYYTYDVTDLVHSDNNAIGAWVADGWYSGYCAVGLLTGIGTEGIGRYTYGKTPSVMVQLEIEYDDGSRQTIGTDKTWKVTGDGPIRQADLLMGEFFDARMEIPDWSTSDFDDSGWEQAILATENGHPTATFYEYRNPTQPNEKPKIEGRKIDLGFKWPKLEAFPGVPVRVTEEIRPVGITEPAPGTFIFNLGQNFAGTIRLKIKGQAGQQITLRYGEMLHPDGRLMTENLRTARATDYYVLKGDSESEVFQPRFTFHGFQYVEVSGYRGKPNRDTITGLVLHSATPLVSSFECSDSMVNQLFKNVVWTQRANFLDLPTDCPQRDERMGWTGDAQIYVGTATYNADVAAFFTKWLRELMESQRSSGTFPGYAPFPFQHGWDFGTAWCDAATICPWTIWKAYGDTHVIDYCWERMTQFIEWRTRTSKDNLGVAHGNKWGDWLAQEATETPIEYIDTIYFAYSTRLMADMAEATGRKAEAAEYRELFQKIKKAFGKKYVNTNAELAVDTQTAYAQAIFVGLIPEAHQKKFGQHLADKIYLNGTRMGTGFLGTRVLLPALSSAGQHDLATFLLQSHEFPSWGYEIDNGATTIWERWDGYTKEDGFGRHNAAMNSFSHYSFGAVCEWMFRTLAGIDADQPGFKHVIIKPAPPSPLSNADHEPIHWVKASYDSIRGPIRVAWHVGQIPGSPRSGNQRSLACHFHLDVTIPANATATVYLPARDLASVSEGGRPVSETTAGVKWFVLTDNHAQIAIGSGHYSFESAGAVRPAAKALQATEPLDLSVNPNNIDVTGARRLAIWDFRNPEDKKRWQRLHNLKIENREGRVLLVATGDDPRMETVLDQPVSGSLVVALSARTGKVTTVEFFWASPDERFQAGASNARPLNRSTRVKKYLFRVGSSEPLQKLRFDPFPNRYAPSSKGEMQIESLTLYQLVP